MGVVAISHLALHASPLGTLILPQETWSRYYSTIGGSVFRACFCTHMY